ncbi:MAG: DNA helicase RecQ, partial [Slackia sp.]|nr:DNA helicase RecQ [Slackia sp.]
LFEELRALRKQLADAGNIAPYMVFSDRALRDMCARRPKDALDFLEVNGVGSRKLERYGEAFLDAIAKFEAGE